MWELEFGVVELARASGQGRAHLRAEERVQCDLPVTVIGNEREVASGWSLDRSANGARVMLDTSAKYAIGERLRVYIGDDLCIFRVVWAYAENDACVLGLEGSLVVSGEFPIAPQDHTLISAA